MRSVAIDEPRSSVHALYATLSTNAICDNWQKFVWPKCHLFQLKFAQLHLQVLHDHFASWSHLPPLSSGKKLTNIWQGDLEISFEETTSWQTASVFFGGGVLSCKTWYQPPDQSVRRFLPAISDASDSWHSPSSTQIDLLKLKPILKGCCTAHSNSGESFCLYHKLVLLVIKRCQICVRWGAPH